MFRRLTLDFWRLWAVGLITSAVRWLEVLAFAVFAYQKTGSALVVATLTMVRMIPMALFGAIVGAWAERADRRTMLAASLAAMAATSGILGLLAVTGRLEVWHLFVASTINGAGWITDNPLRRMLMGESVGPEKVGRAMSLDVIAGNASRMLGPTMGGFMLAATGIEGVFALSVVLYLAAILAAVTVRTDVEVSTEDEPILSRIRKGFSVAMADKRIAAILALTMIFNLFGWPFTSMIPVIGRDKLGLGPEGVGLLASMDGVGALLAALALASWLTSRWFGPTFVGGVLVYFVGQVGFALAPDAVLASLALAVTGAANAAFAAMQATIVYLAAPPGMRSRLLGVLSVFIGTSLVGLFGVGWLANAVGASNATSLLGGIGLLVTIAAYPLWRSLSRAEQ
jgi:MFS family permease